MHFQKKKLIGTIIMKPGLFNSVCYQLNICKFNVDMYLNSKNCFIIPGVKNFIGVSIKKSAFSTWKSSNISPIKMAYSSFQQTSTNGRSNFPPIVIMHGLLGSKNNWKSLGKVISQKTGRIVYTVDARNHGESPHSSVFDYYSLAEDVAYFMKEISATDGCLIGHSMGGRAMMAVALHNPSIVEKLFVLDISPIGTSQAISSLPQFVEIMRRMSIPEELELHEARKFIDNVLQPVVPEAAIRMFLLANLTKSGSKFAWKANLDAIAEKFHPHISTFPPAKDGTPFTGKSYFIGGASSSHIKPSDHDEIRTLFPKAEFSYIDGAGHWLHSDKPKEFLDTIIPLINSN